MDGQSPRPEEPPIRLTPRWSRRTSTPGGPGPPPAAPQPRRADAAPPEALTPRELEVLGLLAQGKSNPQIAQELVISRLTAKTHVERIIRKLKVSDRTQAALRAIELGLVTPENAG